MMPEECASIRSIARWVLPVLVGPSTAVTPAPGTRPLASVGGDDEKAMFYWVSASLEIYNCVIMRRLCDRGLSSRTSPERIAPESVTPVYVLLRSPQHIGQIARLRTRSSLTRPDKRWFGGEFLKSFGVKES